MENVQEMIAQVVEEVQDAGAEPQEVQQEGEAEEVKPEAEATEEAESINEESESEEEAEAETDEAEPKKESRAEKRIRELNDKKKFAENQALELKAQLEAYKPLIEQVLAKEQSKAEDSIENLDFDTQEELVAYAKQQAVKEIMENIAPQLETLTKKSQEDQYVGNINTWFDKNPDARAVESEMTALVESFSDEEKTLYQKQVLDGNTRILNMLYASVSPNALSNKGTKKTEAIKQAIQEEQAKASTAKASTSGRGAGHTTKSNKEAIADAYQSGNWANLIADMGIR